MKTLLVILIYFTDLQSTCFAQISNSDTIRAAALNDTSKYSFRPGFYLAIPDAPKSQGFRLSNTDEYFFIGTEYEVTLINIDTVFKEFDRNFKKYVLTFKFNADGTKELLDFSMKYQGQKIGLLIENKLVSVATIVSPIDYGIMTLAGKFTEIEIEDLKFEIEDAINYVKRLRSTSKKNVN